MSQDYLEKSPADLLADVAKEMVADLAKLKEESFQLPVKKCIHRSVRQEFGVLPQPLRDLWLLLVFYEKQRSSYNARVDYFSNEDLKRKILEAVLLKQLAKFSDGASIFELDNLRVDENWNLVEMEDDPLSKRR